MKLPVVLPTYNERPNLERVAAGILRHDFTRLLVVDDASPDGTGQIADLSPLKGAQLTELRFANNTRVNDLTPLRGMPASWRERTAWLR